MREQEQGFALAAQCLENLYEGLKAPEIDSGFGFIENGELGIARQSTGDLNALNLPAG